MTHGITANFGGPLKPPSWGGLGLGLSAIPALHALADTAATFGIPIIQVALLFVSVILVIWGHKTDAEGQKAVLREVLCDLQSEWTAQRIQEYRLKYRQRHIRQKHSGQNRI